MNGTNKNKDEDLSSDNTSTVALKKDLGLLEGISFNVGIIGNVVYIHFLISILFKDTAATVILSAANPVRIV